MNSFLTHTHSKSFDDSQLDINSHTNDFDSDLLKLTKHYSTISNMSAENIKTKAFSSELSNS